MPRSPDVEGSAERNLLLTVCTLVGVAGLTAFASAYICGYVLEGFAKSETMVLLITDAGLKSDDANLERKLTAATAALGVCRDLGAALGVGCLGVWVAALYRLAYKNAS